MEVSMEVLLMLIILAMPILFLIGMFKPDKLLFWRKEASSRKMVAVYTCGLFIASFLTLGFIAQPIEPHVEPVATAEATIEDSEETNEEVATEITDKDPETEQGDNVNSDIDEQDKEENTDDIINSTASEIVIPEGDLTVHYIDVGQGDATLLQGSDFTILIDAGRHDGNEVVPYLNHVGVESLDLIIATHPHADHIGQIDKVIESFDVGEVWMNGDETTSQTFERVLDAVLSNETSYNEPRAGEDYEIGSAKIKILNPNSLSGDLNDNSISLKLSYGQVSFLFTGDAETSSESYMSNNFDLSADILQVGHHGSNTSSTNNFLHAVQPSVAIYSAGVNNSYGHPHTEVIDRLNDIGAEIFGTDKDGNITVITDGLSFSVETHQPTGSISVAPAPAPVSPVTENKEPEKQEEQEEPQEVSCPPNTVAINTAGKEELQKIHQIGPDRADQVINLRPFSSYSSLTRISGIGDARVKEIEQQGIICFN